MTDEAFHHKFGKIWADRTVPKLTEEEHEKVEDWAAQCFQTLLFNLVNAEQKQAIYPQFGLDWQWVRARRAWRPSPTPTAAALMTESTNIFRVLIKTLLKAGIITERTQPHVRGVGRHGRARAASRTRWSACDVADAAIDELREINTATARRSGGRSRRSRRRASS